MESVNKFVSEFPNPLLLFQKTPTQGKIIVKKKRLKITTPYLGIVNDKPHVTMICSKKGSGKTFLLKKLLLSERGYKGKYDRIIIFSQTFRAQFQAIWSAFNPKGITVYDCVTDELLMEIFSQQVQSVESGECENVLIVSEDQGNAWRACDDKIVDKFVNNSRHNLISMVTLCQRFVQVSPTIRGAFDVIISFRAVSYSELQALWKEVAVIDQKSFRQMFRGATNEPYSFLLINKLVGRLSYFKNFDKQINELEYEEKK